MNDHVAQILSGHQCRTSPIKALPPTSDFDPSFGLGRIAVLNQPQTLRTIIERWKAYASVASVRVALPSGVQSLDSPISTIGVCVGSGASVFREIKNENLPDLLFTGEMGHHDVRNYAFNRGIALILTEHTNCERGFLCDRLVPMLREALDDGTFPASDPSSGSFDFIISKEDRDPVEII